MTTSGIYETRVGYCSPEKNMKIQLAILGMKNDIYLGKITKSARVYFIFGGKMAVHVVHS